MSEAEKKSVGSTAPKTVASGPTVQPAATASAGTHAAQSMPAFGGNRGGKKRADGLAPGSPEAIEADKKKDRDRKKRERQPDPAPLPAANAAQPGPSAIATQATPGSVASVPVIEAPAWRPEDVQSMVDNGLPLLEEIRRTSKINRLIEAGVPENVIADASKSFVWDDKVKTSLSASLPGTAAKVANLMHLPTTFKEELTSVPALAYLISLELKQNAQIERLIQTYQQAKPKDGKPEEKKP